MIDKGKAGKSLLLDFDLKRGGGVDTRLDDPEELDENRSIRGGGGVVEGLSELRLGEGERRGVEVMSGEEGKGGIGGAILLRGEGDFPTRGLRGLICVYVS